MGCPQPCPVSPGAVGVTLVPHVAPHGTPALPQLHGGTVLVSQSGGDTVLGTPPHMHGGTVSGLQPRAHCHTRMGGHCARVTTTPVQGDKCQGHCHTCTGGAPNRGHCTTPPVQGDGDRITCTGGVCPGLPATPAMCSAVPRSPPDSAGVTAARALRGGGHSWGHRHTRIGGASARVTPTHLRGVHPGAVSPQPRREGSKR